MNEDENNRIVRYFEWVDDEGRYSKDSIYARLIQRQKRIIRNVDNEEPIDEGISFNGNLFSRIAKFFDLSLWFSD